MFLTLKRRVGVGFTLSYLIALSLVIGVGILAIARLGQISVTVDDLIGNLAVDRALSDDIINQILLTRFYANKYVRTRDQADVDHFDDEFARLEALLAQADRQITSPERVEMINRIESAVREYGDTFQKVAELIRKHQRVHSEVLRAQEVVIKNNLTALRIHTLSLNNPRLFLAFVNAQDAFHVMVLKATEYLEVGDEGYTVQFETGYQQAQAAFSSLETILQDSAQHQNAANAKAATDAYYEGFQTIHADYVELGNLFETRLNVLEPEIGNIASEITSSVEREFQAQSEFSRALILQTRLVLVVTTTVAILAGLGLGIVINRRIVERDQAAAEVRAEREKSEAILHSVGDAIAVIDLEMRVQYINPAFTTLTGYVAQEAIGQSINPLLEETMSRPTQQAMQTALKKGEIWQGEVSGLRKDGQRYDAVLTTASLRDTEGNLTGYVFSHLDISQGKALERARSQFLDNVSHQLRTPVTTVQLYAHLIQQTEMSEKNRDYFGTMRKEIDQLIQLMQDILEMTAWDSGKAVITWGPVSLSTIVEDTITRYQSRAETSGLTLAAAPLPPDSPVVEGDQDRLLQALGEVVENAIVFTPGLAQSASGGRVTLKVETVEDEGRTWVTVAVQDTGPGILPEEQEKVFDRFFRGSLAESGHIPGIGLGLSIAQEIMRAHGSRVTVESGEAGSTFRLWLPVNTV